MSDELTRENARMLFDLHHKQLQQRREKIHGISERAIGVFLIVGGWIVIGQQDMSRWLQILVIGSMVVVAMGACRMLWSNNSSYLTTAGVRPRPYTTSIIFVK